MSKLEVKYIDGTVEKRDITAVDVSASNKFLILKMTDSRKELIPLCNIKNIQVDGKYKQIRDE